MLQLKKFNVVIDGAKKTAIVVERTPDPKKQDTRPKSIHHIHVLDRSGSMYNSIDQLIDNVQRTFDLIGDSDYVSIVWFASAGQYRTVVKGARKTDDIKKLLDSLRSVLGTTCFSDPLKEVGQIVDELAAICPVFNVTLFTDGCPVTPWTPAEEERRCLEIAHAMAGKIVALNTVGYGYHYNREFLVSLAGTSQHGTMTHSSRIEEYYAIFGQSRERVGGMVDDPIDIAAPGAQVLLVSEKATKLANSSMQLRQLPEGRNAFYLISDGAFCFEVDGQRVDSSSLPLTNIGDIKGQVDDMLYAYTYQSYYQGRRQVALDVLAKNLKDKALVDSHLNAFTYDEVAEQLRKLEAAVADPKARYADGMCPPGYVPKADALCVMDVLKTLFEGNNFYVPYSDRVKGYERVGRKAEDSHNLFRASQKEVLSPVSDFIFNKERLNISLRFTQDGTVDLNPASAKRVGLPKTADCKVYRTHTIVKDGILNVRDAEFKVDRATLDKLRERGCPMTEVDLDRIVIHFGKLPIVNRMYIDGSQDIAQVFQRTLKITQLEAAQKVVGFYLDKVRDDLRKAGDTGTQYTPDQLQVLEDHGIRNGVYGGVDVSTKSAEDSDFYEARTMEFYLKGFTSLPKVQEVLDKASGGKKVNEAGRLMLDYNVDLATRARKAGVDLTRVAPETRAFLELELRLIKGDLLKERTVLNTLKLAKVLTGDWWVDLKTDDKGNYLYEAAPYTMVARADRTKVYI
jgi:hypothetical protein